MLYHFERFSLDSGRRELRRDGVAVSVEPKVFDLIVCLVVRRDGVVSKDDLIKSVWNGRIVSESALATCINAARAALQDSGGEQRLIRTLPRKGLRFVYPVTQQNPLSTIAKPEEQASRLALPDKPSIAVLPFVNMSSDPEQEYFADGIVADIIAGLARINWLFVIPRNSSFVYKHRPTDVKQVCRELGVRYALEGSIRKAGSRVRITAELIDAENGAHIWVERYDRELDDIFALQDEISEKVVLALEPSLRDAEAKRLQSRPRVSFEAYDLVLRAQPYAHSHVPEDAAIAIPILIEALAIEPDYAGAHAPLSLCYHSRFSRAGLAEADRQSAIRHAHAAIASGADDATALGIAGFVIALDAHDRTTALQAFDRALALSNSNFFALSPSALALSWMGQTGPAIDRASRALRLRADPESC